MKLPLIYKQATLAALVTLTAGNAVAAWTVNGSFCQTYSDDGHLMIRVRPSTLGIIEQIQNCNGRGATNLTGSNYGVNGTAYPSSLQCNAQSNFQAVQTTVATQDIKSVISELSSKSEVKFNTFGTTSSVSTAGFAQACASIIGQRVAEFEPQETYKRDMAKMGYEQGPDGQWRKKSKPALTPQDSIAADSAPVSIEIADARNAAMKAYGKEMGSDMLADADFSSYSESVISGNRAVIFEVYNPAYRSYADVSVIYNPQAKVIKTTVLDKGR